MIKVMCVRPDTLAYVIDMKTRFDENFAHSQEIHKKGYYHLLQSLRRNYQSSRGVKSFHIGS